MNDTVRGLVLLASLVLWLPFLPPLLSGDLTLEQGLVRYGCALLLAWVAGAGLSALVRGYSAETEQRAAEQPPQTPTGQQRRSQDRPAVEPVPGQE